MKLLKKAAIVTVGSAMLLGSSIMPAFASYGNYNYGRYNDYGRYHHRRDNHRDYDRYFDRYDRFGRNRSDFRFNERTDIDIRNDFEVNNDIDIDANTGDNRATGGRRGDATVRSGDIEIDVSADTRF